MSTIKSAPASKRPSSTGSARLSGDLIVMAALIGVSRALFGPAKASAQPKSFPTGGEAARGRSAETPAAIPARGWMDIAWRVLEGFQSDRVMLVAAGVTFYGLLALFPAIAAVVSLYGLFTDATTITNHLGLLSGFLPAGALDVIGDQVKLLTAQGQGTLGVHLHWHAGAMVAWAKRANRLKWLLGTGVVQNSMKRRIEKKVKGPSTAKRDRQPTFVWGEATNARGDKRTARIKTANGYSLTVTGALAVVEHLLAHDVPGGFYTPAKLIGADLVARLPGSGPMQIA